MPGTQRRGQVGEPQQMACLGITHMFYGKGQGCCCALRTATSAKRGEDIRSSCPEISKIGPWVFSTGMVACSTRLRFWRAATYPGCQRHWRVGPIDGASDDATPHKRQWPTMPGPRGWGLWVCRATHGDAHPQHAAGDIGHHRANCGKGRTKQERQFPATRLA